MKNSIFIILFLFWGCETHRVVERGVVPTIKLLQGEWIGVDLSNYFHINQEKIKMVDNSLFNFNISNDSLWIRASNEAKGYNPILLKIGDSQFTLMTRTEGVNYRTFQYIFDNIDEYGTHMDTNKIYVMGNFNNWNRTSHPLQFDGLSWSLTLPFPPGNYEYKFVVNGEELLDPQNKFYKPNGLGGHNSIFSYNGTVNKALCIAKHGWIDSKNELLFIEQNVHNDSLSYEIMFNNQYLSPSYYKWVEDNEQSFTTKLSVNIGHLNDGVLRIYSDEYRNGQSFLENQTIIKSGRPLTPDIDKNNSYFKVLYSLMVDRFFNGDKGNDKPVDDPDVHPLANYHGGDILGVTKKIKEGYFSNLGINTIWISPVVQGPDTSFTESIPPHRKYTGYHGYWPVESRKVDERFGSKDELKEMIDTAHENEISVILDFVSNHTHQEHPYYTNHPHWYGNVELKDGTLNIRNWSEETMLTTWFDSFLPSFDYENNDELINQIVNDAVYWINEFGFDGFRQDATKHVPHKFWKSLRSKLDDEFHQKEIFQIGETFGSDELIQSYVNPGELDSQFNFSNYFGFRDLFTNSEDVNGNEILNLIYRNLNQYGPIHLMGNITSSHDQTRLMALLDKQISIGENGVERAYSDLPIEVNNPLSYNKHFLLTAMNMILPGIPVIYYGEEYGQIGANDPGNRTDMRFVDDWNRNEKELYNKVRMISNARQKFPSMALGDLSEIYYVDNVLIIKKQYFNEETIFIFNLSDDNKFLDRIPNRDSKWNSMLDRSVLVVEKGKSSLELSPYETKAYFLHD